MPAESDRSTPQQRQDEVLDINFVPSDHDNTQATSRTGTYTDLLRAIEQVWQQGWSSHNTFTFFGIVHQDISCRISMSSLMSAVEASPMECFQDDLEHLMIFEEAADGTFAPRALRAYEFRMSDGEVFVGRCFRPPSMAVDGHLARGRRDRSRSRRPSAAPSRAHSEAGSDPGRSRGRSPRGARAPGRRRSPTPGSRRRAASASSYRSSRADSDELDELARESKELWEDAYGGFWPAAGDIVLLQSFDDHVMPTVLAPRITPDGERPAPGAEFWSPSCILEAESALNEAGFDVTVHLRTDLVTADQSDPTYATLLQLREAGGDFANCPFVVAVGTLCGNTYYGVGVDHDTARAHHGANLALLAHSRGAEQPIVGVENIVEHCRQNHNVWIAHPGCKASVRRLQRQQATRFGPRFKAPEIIEYVPDDPASPVASPMTPPGSAVSLPGQAHWRHRRQRRGCRCTPVQPTLGGRPTNRQTPRSSTECGTMSASSSARCAASGITIGAFPERHCASTVALRAAKGRTCATIARAPSTFRKGAPSRQTLCTSGSANLLRRSLHRSGSCSSNMHASAAPAAGAHARHRRAATRRLRRHRFPPRGTWDPIPRPTLCIGADREGPCQRWVLTRPSSAAAARAQAQCRQRHPHQWGPVRQGHPRSRAPTRGSARILPQARARSSIPREPHGNPRRHGRQSHSPHGSA